MHDTEATTMTSRRVSSAVGGAVAQPLDLVVDRGVLLDVGVGLRDVGLGLVVVVVGDEVLDGVVRQQLAELVGELGGQGLVGRHDERGPLRPARPSRQWWPTCRYPWRRAARCPAPPPGPRREVGDGRRLVAGGLEAGDDLEGRDAALEVGGRTHVPTVCRATDSGVHGTGTPRAEGRRPSAPVRDPTAGRRRPWQGPTRAPSPVPTRAPPSNGGPAAKRRRLRRWTRTTGSARRSTPLAGAGPDHAALARRARPPGACFQRCSLAGATLCGRSGWRSWTAHGAGGPRSSRSRTATRPTTTSPGSVGRSGFEQPSSASPRARWQEANARPDRATDRLVQPDADPRAMHVAHHGAEADAEDAVSAWGAMTALGPGRARRPLLARTSPRYRSWPDPLRAAQEVGEAHAVLPDRLRSLPTVAAGFSAGGRIALRWSLVGRPRPREGRRRRRARPVRRGPRRARGAGRAAARGARRRCGRRPRAGRDGFGGAAAPERLHPRTWSLVWATGSRTTWPPAWLPALDALT